MADVVLALDGVEKRYVAGEVEVAALRGVSLAVRRGEFVAIVGTSGSGKSTMLNILGCLDRPTRGTYRFLDHEVSSLDVETLAKVRARFLGFVFQGFHLLAGTTAQENVELPLVYRGVPPDERRRRARAALELVGLGDRRDHTPNQLSGGQQQRVAIARALVVEPEVLFADEPTGNLDTATTDEILALLQRLNEEQGLTIVMVTHEPDVARAAQRIVATRDGRIVSDAPVAEPRRLPRAPTATTTTIVKGARPTGAMSPTAMATMGLRLALSSLRRAKLRSGLTTLGILIGIAAVVTTTALGAGAQKRMEREMMALGANMLVVQPSSGQSQGGARGAQGAAGGLTIEDAEAIRIEVPAVGAAAPIASANQQVVVGALNAATRITGTTPDYLKVRAWGVSEGVPFDEEDVRTSATSCLLGQTVKRTLFPDGENPLGRSVRVGRTPCTVVGVLAPKGQSGFGQDQDDLVMMPLTAFRAHVAKKAGRDVDAIVVSAKDAGAVRRAEIGIGKLLRQRHRLTADAEDDFSVRNLAEMMRAFDAQRAAITVLLLVVASVSLLVGGIGVMNIMLVSVTERTREIGVRLAIGARPVDILAQFLLEAIVLALIGGVAGLTVGWGAGWALQQLTEYNVDVQPRSALLAVAISGGIGVVFGFFPARRAAGLDPIASLRHE